MNRLTNNIGNFERKLLTSVTSGDELAFSQLFKIYAPKLAEYVFRMTESLESTEEIIQDVFTVVWQKRSSLSQVDSFSNYIFIISKNKTLNHLRKNAVERKRHIDWLNYVSDENFFTDHDFDKEKLYATLDDAVERLPARQKLVFTLSRVNNLKYHEIAKQLGISKETVKKHIQYAMLYLKKNVRFLINFLFSITLFS